MKATRTLLTLFMLAVFLEGTARAAGSADTHCSFWIDLYRGEPVSFQSMIDDLQGVSVIYIGESHTIARHHAEQVRIVTELKGRGRSVVLAIEQVESFNQAALDRYNSGEIDFMDFAAQTKWAERWSNYPDYRPLVEAAHAGGGTILALNARTELVRDVAHNGREGISETFRAELPAPFHASARYEKYVKKLLGVHSFVNEKSLHRVFQAQAVRDDAMAGAIVRALREPGSRGKTMVVIAGAAHVAYGLGIPGRVKSALPDVTERILVLSQSGELELGESERKIFREIDFDHAGMRFLSLPVADYLMVTRFNRKDEDK
ncbi:MAG: hypothetical protein EPN93_01730 [Spirochaetes bacterium]|nr:MAG: hypothetical protein EPN93_01730 [Spirochaetota bacterium]